MGHKEGEQFSFHWWDHVFNKASSGLVVESGQVSNMKRIKHFSNYLGLKLSLLLFFVKY